jgi:succinoglycan biosynthesis protein ExoA
VSDSWSRPLTVVGVTAGFVGAAAGRPWMLAAPLVYGVGVVGAAATAPAPDPLARLALAAVFPTMHGAWGAGFLLGVHDREHGVATVTDR